MNITVFAPIIICVPRYSCCPNNVRPLGPTVRTEMRISSSSLAMTGRVDYDPLFAISFASVQNARTMLVTPKSNVVISISVS